MHLVITAVGSVQKSNHSHAHQLRLSSSFNYWCSIFSTYFCAKKGESSDNCLLRSIFCKIDFLRNLPLQCSTHILLSKISSRRKTLIEHFLWNLANFSLDTQTSPKWKNWIFSVRKLCDQKICNFGNVFAYHMYITILADESWFLSSLVHNTKQFRWHSAVN